MVAIIFQFVTFHPYIFLKTCIGYVQLYTSINSCTSFYPPPDEVESVAQGGVASDLRLASHPSAFSFPEQISETYGLGFFVILHTCIPNLGRVDVLFVAYDLHVYAKIA